MNISAASASNKGRTSTTSCSDTRDAAYGWLRRCYRQERGISATLTMVMPPAAVQAMVN